MPKRIRILTQGDAEAVADLIIQGAYKAEENRSGKDDCGCIACRVRRALVERPDLELDAFSDDDSVNMATELSNKLLQILASGQIHSEDEAMRIVAQSFAACCVAGYLRGEELGEVRGWKKAMEEA